MPLRPAATIVTDMTTPRIGPHGDAGDPIFGRERELARLYELVDGVHERGEVLLVGGEAGIGKSTLLAAATRHAETRGCRCCARVGCTPRQRCRSRGYTGLSCRCSTHRAPALTAAHSVDVRLGHGGGSDP